jgi:hypothetical protein
MLQIEEVDKEKMNDEMATSVDECKYVSSSNAMLMSTLPVD